jgi:hypothetical protein
MQQSLHLLVVDLERREAVAARYGGKWILPILRTPERARAGPLLLEWASQHGIAGLVAGQWLGCVAPSSDTVDWLAVVDARAKDPAGGAASLEWRSLASLAASTAWLTYQQWAIGRVLSTSDLPAVVGPFGTMTWTRDVQGWVEEVTGPLPSGTLDAVVPHRVTAYEVVLEFRTTRGPVYFKGLSSDRAFEARLAAKLADIAPKSFARTLALSTRPDRTVWWLMEACPGSTLAACLTCARAAHVAAAYAHIQQRTMNVVEDGRLGGLVRLELSPMAAWAAALLRETGQQGPSDQCAAAVAAIDDACERASHADVPHSWMSADFDPTNVLIDGDDVRFIDLDDCALGPAPIAVSTFAKRITRLEISCGHELYGNYERAWNPALNVHGRWRDFETVATLVECYHAWGRVKMKTEREEIHGALEPARVALARRLARAVHTALA